MYVIVNRMCKFDPTLVQKTAIISPNEPLELNHTLVTCIERFSVVESDPSMNGQRLTILADHSAISCAGNPIHSECPISSLIIGNQYEQTAGQIFGIGDKCTLRVLGPLQVKVQVLYTETREVPEASI